jgi:hypothetical protein
MADYELWLSTDEAVRLTTLDLTGGFEYVKRVNGIGAWHVNLPADFDIKLTGLPFRRPDHLVEFWRGTGSVRKSLELVGFLRWAEFSHDSNGHQSIVIGGPDQNELLHRRIVAFASGETESSKAGNADDLMKEVVDENMGGSAAVARDITGIGFSIQTDLTLGPSIEQDFAWKHVDDVLERMAEAADTGGTSTYYGIVPLAPDDFEFRTWVGQPGQDRTDPAKPVVFSIERGNLINPFLRIDYGDEVNYVYAGGQDVGTARNVQEVSDTTRIEASIWNRREAFQDARRGDTDAAVTEEGNAALKRGQFVRRFMGEILDTDLARYGKHWDLGDRVIAEYWGAQFECIVQMVKVAVDASGRESVVAKLEWEP